MYLKHLYSAAWQGRLFPSVFVFIFLCVWQGETPHTAAAGKCRGSCFVFFFLCFCFCVFVWQGGTLEHLPLQQLDNGGGREEGIEWLANQLTAPGCYYVQIFIWKQNKSSKVCVCTKLAMEWNMPVIDFHHFILAKKRQHLIPGPVCGQFCDFFFRMKQPLDEQDLQQDLVFNKLPTQRANPGFVGQTRKGARLSHSSRRHTAREGTSGQN